MAPKGVDPQEVDRPKHQPFLLWLVNNWAIAEPLLQAAVAKLDPKNDTLLLDVRTKRGVAVSTLDHAAVFAAARVVEITGIRQSLTSHPFLYNNKWTKNMSMPDHFVDHMRSRVTNLRITNRAKSLLVW